MAFVKGDCSRRGLLGRGRGDRGSEARRGVGRGAWPGDRFGSGKVRSAEVRSSN